VGRRGRCGREEARPREAAAVESTGLIAAEKFELRGRLRRCAWEAGKAVEPASWGRKARRDVAAAAAHPPASAATRPQIAVET
jgi:hypothetical protein